MDIESSEVATSQVATSSLEKSLLDAKRNAQTGWGGDDPRNWGWPKLIIAGGVVVGSAAVIGVAVGLSTSADGSGDLPTFPPDDICDYGIDVQSDTLETCVAVHGNVLFQDRSLPGMFNLSDYLPNVIYIQGDLIIRSNQGLNTLSLGPLHSDGSGLSVDGDVFILDNTGLTAMDLDKLERVGGALSLQGNLPMTLEHSFSAANLITAKDIHVFGSAFERFFMPRLESVTGVLRIMGDLNAGSLNSITQINLPELRSIRTGLWIVEEPWLQVISMPKLTNLSFSENTLGYITDNYELQQIFLQGLTIDPPGGAFPIVVANNLRLATCSVAGCAPNNQCRQPCTASCPYDSFPTNDICDDDIQICEGNIDVTPDTFLGCTVVTGSIHITGVVDGDVDLSLFLPNLELIEMDLYIGNNNMASFTLGPYSQDGSNSISILGSLIIRSNTGLSSMNLDRVRSVLRNVEIEDNQHRPGIQGGFPFSCAGLTDAFKFEVLTTSIALLSLPRLRSVDAFVVGGSSTTPERNTMAAIETPLLQFITSNLEVYNETSLQSISMPALVNLCDIGEGCTGTHGISGNPSLKSVSMPNVDAQGEAGQTVVFPLHFENNGDGLMGILCTIAGCVDGLCGSLCTEDCPFTAFQTDDICVFLPPPFSFSFDFNRNGD